MYYVQFVQGTQGQTGHLAERIRISGKPVRESGDLTFGWQVTASEEMTERQVRKLFKENGIPYPAHIPIVHGDYSISEPAWNAQYWHWSRSPDPDFPIHMQPRWWRLHNWDEFPNDPCGMDITLRDWQRSHAT